MFSGTALRTAADGSEQIDAVCSFSKDIFLAYFIIYSPLLMRRMSINSRRGTCLEASCQCVSLETFARPHTVSMSQYLSLSYCFL